MKSVHKHIRDLLDWWRFKGVHLTNFLLLRIFGTMAVVKIHSDDLQAIYDILGDYLSRKQGRPTAAAAEDLRSRASASQELLSAILGINQNPPLVVEPIRFPPMAESPAEETVEEVVEAVAAEITPEVGPLADAPEPVLEGDEADS